MIGTLSEMNTWCSARCFEPDLEAYRGGRAPAVVLENYCGEGRMPLELWASCWSISNDLNCWVKLLS